MKTKEEFLDSVYEKYEQARIETEAEERKVVIKRKQLYKKWGTIAACLVLCVGLISGTGMLRMGGRAADSAALEGESFYALDGGYNGGSYAQNKSGSTNGFVEPAASAPMDEGYYDYDYETAYEGESADYPDQWNSTEAGDSSGEKAVSNQKTKELKLIYRANMTLQTTDFDQTVAGLKKTVDSFGGYFESQEVYNGGYFQEDAYKSGYYTVRIPADKYREFLDAVGNDYYISNISESIEDIGKAYYDTEKHIETLKIKEERLQDLLKKAAELSDIIELENALSQTEYELEMYESTLDDYDSLVGYSTINIDIEKVSQFTGGTSERSFFERFGSALRNGAINFVEGLGDFFVWLGYNIIGIVVFFAIVFAIIRFDLIGKIGGLFSGSFARGRERRAARKARKAEKANK